MFDIDPNAIVNGIITWPLPDHVYKTLDAMDHLRVICKTYNVADAAEHLIEVAKELQVSASSGFISTLEEMGHLIRGGNIDSKELMSASIQQWERYLAVQANRPLVIIWGLDSLSIFRSFSALDK